MTTDEPRDYPDIATDVEPVPARPEQAAHSLVTARAHFHEALFMLACAAQATDQRPESAPEMAHTALRFLLDGIDALEHAAAHNLPCAGTA